MKKKKLEEAELRVVKFELNDVIVASGCVPNLVCSSNCDDNCKPFGLHCDVVYSCTSYE